MTELEKMWAALETHQPTADKKGYGKAWARMCRERTRIDAAYAVDVAYAAYAALTAAYAAALEAAEDVDVAYAVDAAFAASLAAAAVADRNSKRAIADSGEQA